MLGESDLLIGPLEPGGRMASMMSPTIALDAEGLVLAAGAAGGTRLRPALAQVLSGILDQDLSAAGGGRPSAAPLDGQRSSISSPGSRRAAIVALEGEGYDVRLWSELHHYFGGVSAVARAGAAADPRRSGSALSLP